MGAGAGRQHRVVMARMEVGSSPEEAAARSSPSSTDEWAASKASLEGALASSEPSVAAAPWRITFCCPFASFLFARRLLGF